MHAIQRHILGTLMERSPRRFSELKPSDTESNLFMYHLRRLISAGHISKQGETYGLTEAGKVFIDGLSGETLAVRAQPKILTEVACRNKQGEWLLYRRAKEPFRGLVGFPSGKIHIGERIAEAAARELKSKTGYEAKIEHKGNLYMTTRRDGAIASHLLTHVFAGTIRTGELAGPTTLGEAFWQSLTAEEAREQQYFPGLAEVIEHVEARREGQFFGEYFFDR